MSMYSRQKKQGDSPWAKKKEEEQQGGDEGGGGGRSFNTGNDEHRSRANSARRPGSGRR